jgi:3-dehydroquinate synthase
MKSINHLKFDSKNAIVFYDEKLNQFQAFVQWIRKYPNSISLRAGEGLKTLKVYSQTLNLIQRVAATQRLGRHFKMIAVGGGSITDFVGFLAATYQRGHPWVAVPSTWLSAIDSAHGGKNGLNLNGVKNQIGTIFFPEKVIICEELLRLQPIKRLIESAGEILKINLICSSVKFEKFELSEQFVLKNLNSYIRFKNSIVEQDPFETKKIRYVLNFGHTVGHVLETEKKLPHGIAVLFGIVFAIHFSLSKRHITAKTASSVLKKIENDVFSPHLKLLLKKAFKISQGVLVEKLLQDKKNMGKKISFIFIEKPGKVFVSNTTVTEVARQFKILSARGDFFNV